MSLSLTQSVAVLVDLLWVGLVVAAIVWLAYVRWLRETPPEPGTIEHVEYLYTRGDISEHELERRLDVLADPRAQELRTTVETINGIGEDTSWALAAEFESVTALKNADRERLEGVPGVGPHTADAIETYLKQS